MIRNKIECKKCERLISLSNHKRHTQSCNGKKVSSNKTIEENHIDWKTIQEDYDNGLTYRGITEKYKICQQSISNARKKGLLKTRSKSEASKLYYKNNTPNIMSDEARKRISEKMSEHNHGGRSKWFEIDGKKVQGTWELNFAKFCKENNIEWQRCKPWKYKMDKKIRSYTPDFYIPSKKLFIEIKGHWWGDDRRKMNCVIEQHPDKNILIIEKEIYEQMLDGKLEW